MFYTSVKRHRCPPHPRLAYGQFEERHRLKKFRILDLLEGKVARRAAILFVILIILMIGIAML